MKHRGRRRTLYSLLGALGLAATVFLYFQLFSIEMMDFHQRESESPEFRKKGAHLRLKNYQRKGEDVETDKPLDRHSDGWKSYHEDDCDSADCDDLEKKLRIGKRIGKQLPIARHNAAAASHEQNYLNGDSIKGLPQGAKKELASLYKPNDQNMFICLESKEMISFEWVNDDYCDCSDGSDEPGTSACLDNRFYCTFQGGFKKDIPSGRVNDGICDCCDGSDEWMKRMLPKQVKIDDKPHYGYYQAPCVNRCDQEVRQAKQVSSIHQQGAALKQKYIQAAKGQSNPNWLYGPNGEFFTLSRNCYEIKPDKYEYKVCPFKEIRQQVFPEPSTLIGQVPEWLEQGENGHWILKMSAGDSKQCPGGARRLSFLKFECGLSDNIVSVQETEVCQYTIQFSTPAAC